MKKFMVNGGEIMQLFFDEKMIFKKVEDEFFIAYSDSTRVIIKLSVEIVNYIKTIFAQKSGYNFDIEGYEELIEVLKGLGYKEKEIKAVVVKVNQELSLEEQVKEALKLLLK